MTHAVLHLCGTCIPELSEKLRLDIEHALRSAGLSADVRLQACLNACSDPVSLALQGNGMATYFFSGIDVKRDLQDITATVQLYLNSPNGWIEDARPCGRLRLLLKGRVPTLSS